MKQSDLKRIIKEEVNRELMMEGIIDKIVSTIIDKVVRSKYKTYFDTLNNDPDYQEKLKAVKLAVTDIDNYGEAALKARAKADKSYKELVRKFGKKAADNMVADVHSNKFQWGAWSNADKKRYTGK
jgi:uncharacterized protein YaaR (DUF327 family)